MSNKIKKLAPAILAKIEKEQTDEENDGEESESKESEEEKVDLSKRRIAKAVRSKTVPKKTAAVAKKDQEMIEEAPSKKLTGQKRKRASSEHESEFSNDPPIKKQKGQNGKTKQIKQEPAKKSPPKPQVLKIGKWNPDVELISFEEVKESKSNNYIFNCCTRCNNRNIVRAAYT